MPDILTKQDGPILRITLNQPERGNAVSDEMVAELTGIIEGAEKTSSVVVLRGAGEDFCVGRAVMGSTPKQDPDALRAPHLQRRGVQLLRRHAQRQNPDRRRRARPRARLRLRHRGGLRHHAGQRQGGVSGPRNGAQHPAHHGDVVVRRPRAAQGDELSGLFAGRDQPGARAELRHRQRRGAGGASSTTPSRRCAPRFSRRRGRPSSASRNTSRPRPTWRCSAPSNSPATCTPPSIHRARCGGNISARVHYNVAFSGGRCAEPPH